MNFLFSRSLGEMMGNGAVFGKTAKDITLEQSSAKGFTNDFVQKFYKVNYNELAYGY